MTDWNDTLVREIADRRVIIFIGAGISKAICPTFPSWSTLLERLASKLSRAKDKSAVKQMIRQQKLLDAAQVIKDGVAKAELGAELRKIFQIRPTPFGEIYDDLLALDPKTIITTNYDEFIEENFKHYSKGAEAHSISDQKSSKLLNDLRSPIRSIVKMHGSVDDPVNLVLDRSSFFTVRQNNPSLFYIVSSLMTINTVLFIGYFISDPDIQLILENINLSAPSDHRHYALVPKFEHKSVRDALSKTYNIEFVEYPAGSHGSVPAAIHDLGRIDI